MPVRLERNGKEAIYETIEERVRRFREKYPISSGWALTTEIVSINDEKVLCRGMIKDPKGTVVADGLAEELRNSSIINKTSAVENCETSSWGRALAAGGFGYGEFCSLDELSYALKQQDAIRKATINLVPSVPQKPRAQEPGVMAGPPAAPIEIPGKSKPDNSGNSMEKRKKEPDDIVKGLPVLKGVTYEKKDNFIVAIGNVYRNRNDLKDVGFMFSQELKKWTLQGGQAV